MYSMGMSEVEILKFARPVLAPSLRWQRRAVLTPAELEAYGWRPSARITIRPEFEGRPAGEMLGFPHPTGIDLRINLGQEWYETAKRTGVLEVGGYFISRYDSFDDQGRPVKVQAVRLVETDRGPDWEYIPSPATIRWGGDQPTLRWRVPDDKKAWKRYIGAGR